MNQVCLAPRETAVQSCLYCRISTNPQATFHDKRTDYFGNQIDYFSFERGYHKLEIRAHSKIEVQPRSIPELTSSPPVEQLRQQLKQPTEPLDLLVSNFLVTSPHIE